MARVGVTDPAFTPARPGAIADAMSLLALILLQVAPPGEAEVVVIARRRTCEISIADRIVKDREFRARAREWANGTPVRVVVADRADYRCLAKIAFRLKDYGVTRIVFDPPGPGR